MSDLSDVKPGMSVIGADGVPIGKVGAIVGDRIALEAVKIGGHKGHKHFVPGGLVTIVEDHTVRISATGANALLLDEEEDGTSAD